MTAITLFETVLNFLIAHAKFQFVVIVKLLLLHVHTYIYIGLFHQNILGTSVMGNPGLPQLRVMEHNRALETMGSNGKQWIW